MTKARDLADLGNGVTEADIAASNSATNGYMLTAQSGNTGGLTWAEAPSSFAPVAVTGATPSLNVGSYNYFSGATFNADTTISFASVPTNARWTYSALIAAESGYNLAGAVKDDASFYGGAKEWGGLTFSPDGLYMFMVSDTDNGFYRYTLTTAWDVSTAGSPFGRDISSEEGSPRGMTLSSDGTKVYVVGTQADDLNEYELSTPWDLSTETLTSTLTLSPTSGVPRDIVFKPDGLKLYITDDQNDEVNEYTLSTAWDSSTASHSTLIALGAVTTNPMSTAFNSDGTKMFVCENNNEQILEYSLSTAWLVSSATFTGNAFSLRDLEIIATSLTFSADGSKMYVVGHEKHVVYQFSTDGFATLTLPAACSHTPTPTYVAGKRITLEFATLDGGTTVDVIQASVS